MGWGGVERSEGLGWGGVEGARVYIHKLYNIQGERLFVRLVFFIEMHGLDSVK